jgi:hypothetical protein
MNIIFFGSNKNILKKNYYYIKINYYFIVMKIINFTNLKENNIKKFKNFVILKKNL